MDSLVLVALLMLVMWAVAFGFYFYLNRQQTDLKEDIDSVQALLDKDKTGNSE